MISFLILHIVASLILLGLGFVAGICLMVLMDEISRTRVNKRHSRRT